MRITCPHCGHIGKSKAHIQSQGARAHCPACAGSFILRRHYKSSAPPETKVAQQPKARFEPRQDDRCAYQLKTDVESKTKSKVAPQLYPDLEFDDRGPISNAGPSFGQAVAAHLKRGALDFVKEGAATLVALTFLGLVVLALGCAIWLSSPSPDSPMTESKLRPVTTAEPIAETVPIAKASCSHEVGTMFQYEGFIYTDYSQARELQRLHNAGTSKDFLNPTAYSQGAHVCPHPERVRVIEANDFFLEVLVEEYGVRRGVHGYIPRYQLTDTSALREGLTKPDP